MQLHFIDMVYIDVEKLILAHFLTIMHTRSTHDEKELLQLVAQGDTHAFTLLYSKYRDKTFSYLLDLVRAPALVEDIFQDVFLKVWDQRASLSEIDNFNAYLYTIIRNRAFDGLRRTAKEHDIIQDLMRNQHAGVPQSDEKLQYGELQNKLHRAVQQLPEQQRRVYLLSREKGLKHEEIAATLDIAVTTVNKHITRALDFLRKNIRTLAFLLIR